MSLRHGLEQLEKVAHKHVYYEMTRMAGYAVHRVPQAQEAILEAHLVHLRNMNEFLTKSLGRARPRDVVAADYFDEEWIGHKAPLTEATVLNLHRRLAHLSLDRLEGTDSTSEFNWASVGEPRSQARRVVSAFGRFLGDLETAHPERRDWFRDAHAIASDILEGSRTTIPKA
jgi:hypothetical protein